MTDKFIILRNSVEQATWAAYTPEQKADPLNFQGKKFKIVYGDEFVTDPLRKTGTMTETINGFLDVSVGPIFFEWRGMARTKETLEQAEIDDHYGSKSDLRTYFMLNNPVGTPSNQITLVDHYGVEHTGMLIGDYMPRPLTTIINGTEAHFLIGINFIQRQAVA